MDENTDNLFEEQGEPEAPLVESAEAMVQSVLDVDAAVAEASSLSDRVSAATDADVSSAVVPAGVTTRTASDGDVSSDTEEGEKGISIITREATVLGDIITEGHIDIIGKVRGNIAAQGDVAIHGQVRGNVNGDKIGLYNSRVKGNLSAGQGVIVNDTSIIDGDVTTKNIIFDGKVRGNIDAESVVVLRSHSYCLGDVTASSIAVEPGAIINGTVRTFIEGDPEAPFEEII